MKNIKILIALSILCMACSETVAPSNDNFVVEGFITANEPVNNIKVKMTSPVEAQDVTNAPISSAQVTLSKGNDTFLLDYNPDTERYIYHGNDLTIASGEEVQMQVRVGDRLANANTLVPEAPTGLTLSDNIIRIPRLSFNFLLGNQIQELFEEERLTLSWTAIEGRKYFVVIESKVAQIDPILPSEIPEQATELLQSFRFISEPSDTPEFEIIGVALETYGLHVAKVFTVNEEYSDLFDNLEQDSRDLNEPPSNVVNALGIFTAFAVDSLEFEVVR